MLRRFLLDQGIAISVRLRVGEAGDPLSPDGTGNQGVELSFGPIASVVVADGYADAVSIKFEKEISRPSRESPSQEITRRLDAPALQPGRDTWIVMKIWPRGHQLVSVTLQIEDSSGELLHVHARSRALDLSRYRHAQEVCLRAYAARVELDEIRVEGFDGSSG